MRIILVAGARPNLIKTAPLLPACERAGIVAEVAFAGPREWGATAESGFMSFWGVRLPEPRWFLDIREDTSAVETGRTLVVLERLLAEESPDAVLAIGDHNATLALAIAAAKQRIPIVHLEAGLRCGDLSVPEEVNRALISRVVGLHLASDEASMSNLVAEGVDPERIALVGSVLAESVIRNAEAVRAFDAAAAYGWSRHGYVIACIRHSENLADPERCRGILGGLEAAGLPVLVPDAHGFAASLSRYGIEPPVSVRIVEALPYPEMLALVRDAAVVVTDSGGVQEEACVFHTPCVTVRRCTERVATLEVGANRLAAADADSLGPAIIQAAEGPRKWVTPKRWDKAVSQRVVRSIRRGLAPLA